MKAAGDSYEADFANEFDTADWVPEGRSHRAGPPRLTPRQLDVLTLLCQGLPNKLICRQLNISPGTVKAHISSILRELGVGSRLQAVIVARRLNLVPVTPAGEAADAASGQGVGPDVARPAPGVRSFELGRLI